MAYIDRAFYDSFYPFSNLSQAQFDYLADYASEVVDRLCGGKIEYFGLTEFAAAVQTKIQRATAAQLQTIENQGGMAVVDGNANTSSGAVSIGRYSESFGKDQKLGQGSNIKIFDGIPISPRVYTILRYSNLLNTAANQCWEVADFR